MPIPQGAASYKKQNGTLAMSKDRKAVSWTPTNPPDASPTVVISASNVTNLQQTPEANPKVMLKIFEQRPGQTEATTHIFTFTAPNTARNEANGIKDSLASVIQAQKTAQMAAANGTAGGTSAAMTIANAVSGGSRSANLWEDDEKLRGDTRLQQSLMSEDPTLQKTFMEARAVKPDSISNTQFTSQFWASRVHLLRAHALSKSQNRGSYNVFSSLRREEGGTKMNLNAEHIHMIFQQYPLMRRVYDETVPTNLNEHDFWSRFFQSKLFSKLRGFKIDDRRDAQDAILDPFLQAPELTGVRPTHTELHIPKLIDLEGNEENNSQRKGNRPDTELRQSVLDKAPIIRTLNTLSEKLMAHVRPSDVDPSAPIGMDEATYENLRLRDLAGDPEEDHMILKIQDQSRFFSSEQSKDAAERPRYRKIDPSRAIQSVRTDLNTHFPPAGSHSITIPEAASDVSDDDYPDFDPDDPDTSSTHTRPLSPSAKATQHIQSLLRTHLSQTTSITPKTPLSTTTYDQLTLTHATTLEFLRQFWSAFLSGDPARVSELASLAESLSRALDRIEAVAQTAEDERKVTLDQAERDALEILKRTGRRRKVDMDAVGGGREAVNQLLAPLVKAVGVATNRYREALKEAGMGMGGGGMDGAADEEE